MCSVSSIKTEVPRTYVRISFYRERDITLMVLLLEHPSLNGGKASDWLRQSQQQETRTRPNRSPRLANETHPEPYGSI